MIRPALLCFSKRLLHEVIGLTSPCTWRRERCPWSSVGTSTVPQVTANVKRLRRFHTYRKCSGIEP